MSEWARIVGVPGEGPMKTQGTRVMVGDQELKGVVKIVLSAEVNNIWRAEIHCIGAGFTDLQAEAIIHRPSAWNRLKRWGSNVSARALGYAWLAKQWLVRRWKFGAFGA